MTEPHAAHSSLPATVEASKLTPATALRLLATGHFVAQAVYVAARLNLADRLADGHKSAEELANETRAHGPSLYRLLRALVAHGVLVEPTPGRFSLTPIGSCLCSKGPNSLRDAVLMW